MPEPLLGEDTLAADRSTELAEDVSVANGAPGLVVEAAGTLVQTMAFEVRNGRIEAMFVVRDPDKLGMRSSRSIG